MVEVIFFESKFDENSAVKETLQAGPGPQRSGTVFYFVVNIMRSSNQLVQLKIRFQPWSQSGLH
jgi:hypothetical protein